jgi:prolipoprotein diacylglyceryltransferase
MLVYPHIDPVAVSIGPFLGVGPLRVHWYGIMYLIGFVSGWALARYRPRVGPGRPPGRPRPDPPGPRWRSMT